MLKLRRLAPLAIVLMVCACSGGSRLGQPVNGLLADAPTPVPAAVTPQVIASPCSEGENAMVSTNHSLQIAGKNVTYTATAGFLEVTLDTSFFASSFHSPSPMGGPPSSDPLPKGCLFFTYYQAQSPTGGPRPLTFAFNGGPGSASFWLHLGALGPKRVNTGPDGLHPQLPFQLADNADSMLDTTDIVMLDPMGTGFSFPQNGTTPDKFYGAYSDAESISIFIRNFLDRFNRRNAPLFVMGESYGGIRGSLVTQLLQSPLYLPVKGLVLVSPWLSSTPTTFTEDDNIVAYYAYFPSFATTAWYHRRAAAKYLSLDVATVYQQAKQFAFGAYRNALGQGNEISNDEMHSVAQQMSEFIGLPVSLIEHLNLRVRDQDFTNGLLYDQHEMIGGYDARFRGLKLLRQDGSNATDPSDPGTGFPFVSAINSYLRNDLKFDPHHAYVDSANMSNWPYNSDSTEFVATHFLSQAFADNANLKVFVASGYYDLVCPMGTVEYERTMLDPASRGRDRMLIHHYESGHMVYINPVALHQLKTDLSGFYSQILSPGADGALASLAHP